jgi:nitrite reductase/ring-hydroxylating ferredoxin subunit
VAVYRRSVAASLERVWENVLDWEHLPWLHRSTFSAIEAVDAGAWGWRARVALQPREPRREILLELRIEPGAERYVARTLEGTGRGSEVWTRLRGAGPERTDVEVEFHAPGVEPGSAAALGGLYTRLYTALWDEDEAMMVRRQRELARRAGPSTAAAGALDLGPLEALRPRLPLCVELGGRRYRVLELGGELRAHATTCPHRLGPLDAGPPEAGVLTCPWHGYRFDLASGRSADGRGLRLPPAPPVRVDPGTGRVWLGS